MTPSNFSDEDFDEAWSAQEAREAAEFNWAKEELRKGILPTPEKARTLIARKIGDEFQEGIRFHVYWKEYKLKIGLSSLIDSFGECCKDFLKTEASLTGYANSSVEFQTHIHQSVNVPAQKELLGACAALFGMKDTLKRISTARPDISDEILDILKEKMSSSEFKFLFDLRKNLSHGSVTVPGWSAATDNEGTRGEIRFSAEELLGFGEWSAETKSFIEKHRTSGILPSTTLKICAKSIRLFQMELEKLFYRNRQPNETDYYSIIDDHNRISSKFYYNLFLKQILKDRDPYSFLSMFFSYEEIRQIERFEKHSKEQVDYMISLKLAKTECDDDLRNLLYEKFGVTTL